MSGTLDHKMLFLLGKTDGQPPVMTVGIPQAAWDRIKDGMTETFDLTKIGLPIKLVIFGAPTHDAALKMVEQGAAKVGITIEDQRGRDFGIETKEADK